MKVRRRHGSVWSRAFWFGVTLLCDAAGSWGSRCGAEGSLLGVGLDVSAFQERDIGVVGDEVEVRRPELWAAANIATASACAVYSAKGHLFGSAKPPRVGCLRRLLVRSTVLRRL